MIFQQRRNILLLVLLSGMAAIIFIALFTPLGDPDFFWHLKTGEWLWQHRALPAEDPFAHTSAGAVSGRAHLILTSYWLSQVLYYLFSLVGSLSSLVFLRLVMIGALLFLLVKRRRGDHLLYFGLLIIFLVVVLRLFPLERPQVFSFLFFALLLYLLDAARDGNYPAKHNVGYILISLSMMLWANLHAGFSTGQALLILYVCAEGIKFSHMSLRPMERNSYKRLCMAAALGLIASLVNPNTYHVWEVLLHYRQKIDHLNLDPGYLAGINRDYMSPIQYFVMFRDYGIVLYWFMLLLTVTGVMIKRRSMNITELLLVAGTGFFSFFTLRYVPFFMIAALPVIAEKYEGRVLAIGRAGILVVALGAGVSYGLEARGNLAYVTTGPPVHHFYPAKAADFIIEHDLRGNMFNTYVWGGYLIWRLAPERKVFVDGRDLFPEITNEAALVENAVDASIAGMPLWKAILQTRGVEYAVLPLTRSTGTLLPLCVALLDDREWMPVFYDVNAMIFIRTSRGSREGAEKLALSPAEVIDGLIGKYDRLREEYPQQASLAVTQKDLQRIRAGLEASHAY